MCSSENELIHDVRQVHLEDMIVKNEEQFVMVRLPLTDEQRMLANGAPYKPDRKGSALEASILAISTHIPPCEDVETVGHLKAEGIPGRFHPEVSVPDVQTITPNIALVRRTDMEAQVSRVVAEKDAEIARLSAALKCMIEIAISRATVQTVEDTVDERTSALKGAIVNAACDLADGIDASTVCRNLRTALHKGSGA